MTEIWLKTCPICLVDLIPLKNFRFFSCGTVLTRRVSLIMSNLRVGIGHRWCSSCLKKHKGDPLCGECRQPKGKAHRIYLDLEDLVDDQVALVADGLRAINMDSSPSAIEKFNLAARKLRQKSNTDPAVSVSTLDSPKYDGSFKVISLREHSSKQSKTSKNGWLLWLRNVQSLKV